MDNSAEILLKGYSPGVQDLIQQARRLIMKLVPDAHEKVYLGWRTIGYSTTGGIPDGFCTIDPQKTRINFVFQRGIDLDDPAGLLEGSGKDLRHVKIETMQQLNSRALKALIKAAATLKPED